MDYPVQPPIVHVAHITIGAEGATSLRVNFIASDTVPFGPALKQWEEKRNCDPEWFTLSYPKYTRGANGELYMEFEETERVAITKDDPC